MAGQTASRPEPTRTPTRTERAIPMRVLAVDYQQGVSDAWTRTATFAPKLVGGLLILLIGWRLARLLSTVLDRVLERVGFDRAVERGGLRQALARSKYDPSD